MQEHALGKFHVRQARNVAHDVLTFGEQGREHDGKRGVLGAARFDSAFEFFGSLNDELVHSAAYLRPHSGALQ
jgi:hypothetical protein